MLNKKLKKMTCAALCAAMAAGGSATGFSGGVLTVSAAEENQNLLKNPSFSNEANDWFSTGNSAKIELQTDNSGQDSAGGYVKITNRTDTWNSLAQNIEKIVKNKTTYNFSCWVKLSDDYTAESTLKVGLTMQSTGDNNGKEDYDKWGITNNTVTISPNDGWKQISGSFTADWTGDLEVLQFKVADENNTNSFYVDNLSLVEVGEVKKSIQTDLKDLKAQFAEDFNAKAGVAIPFSAISDDVRMQLVTKHFNSITAENEMKPDAFLGQEKNFDENGNPILNFTSADKMLDEILKYNTEHSDSPIRVRGHVLVWHSQTPEWFFEDENGSLLSKEAMNTRLEYYIKTVLEHFQTAENGKYKDLIYAWDVVNEAINPADGEAGGLRTKLNGVETFYHKIYGSSNEYIINAFKSAKEYADPSIKLFYNDYGETDPAKVQHISALIREIQNTEGARIDGMGMQAHYDMVSPDIEQFKSAVRSYQEALGTGGEIQLTELDLASSNDYDGSDQDAEYQKQAYRYKAIYDAILSLKKNEGVNFTAVTFWGTDDGVSWLNSSSSVGGGQDGSRPQCPLLFDSNYQAKPAYYAFTDPGQLKPNIQEMTAVQSDSFQCAAARTYTFSAGSAQVSFVPVWNSKGLNVRVTVEDSSADSSDSITLYADTADSRRADASIFTKTITRQDAKSTGTGYQADFTVPLDDAAVMKKIGFDLAVTDGAAAGYWNDLKGSQASTSEYYARMTLKPYIEISQGTVTVDGSQDKAWETAAEVPLAIRTGTSSAEASAKLLWDSKNLYLFAKVKDSDLDVSSSQAHEQDSLELFIDENNKKSGAYEADDKQYRISCENELSFNGENCKAENVKSIVTKTDDGYQVEAAFAWTHLKPEAGNLIGLEMQINDGKGGTRIGTVSWYDETGMGWNMPSVFGTAALKAAEPEKPQDPSTSTPGTSTNPGNSTHPGNTTNPGNTTDPGSDTEKPEPPAPEDPKGPIENKTAAAANENADGTFTDADGNIIKNMLVQTADGTKYIAGADGKKLISAFVETSDGTVYYVKETGIVAEKEIISAPAGKYFAKDTGAIAKSEFCTTAKGSLIYADADGLLAADRIITVEGQKYYAKKNCAIAKKGFFTTSSGNKIYARKTGELILNKVFTAGGKKYFAKANCAVAKNGFFTTAHGNTVYADKSGVLMTNRIFTVRNKNFYAKKSGALAKSTWIKYKNKMYYCSASGKITKTKK